MIFEELQVYNSTHATMDLELFDDAIAHVCRIARILAMPRGHALLVGVGGYGKQSLTKLAAHLCGMELKAITVTRSYDAADFNRDISKLYVKVVVEVVFAH